MYLMSIVQNSFGNIISQRELNNRDIDSKSPIKIVIAF